MGTRQGGEKGGGKWWCARDDSPGGLDAMEESKRAGGARRREGRGKWREGKGEKEHREKCAKVSEEGRRVPRDSSRR